MSETKKSIIAFLVFAIIAIAWVIYFGGKSNEMALHKCKPNHQLQICEFE